MTSHTSTFALFAANSSNVRSRSGSDIRTMPGGMSFSASSCSLKKILFNEEKKTGTHKKSTKGQAICTKGHCGC